MLSWNRVFHHGFSKIDQDTEEKQGYCCALRMWEYLSIEATQNCVSDSSQKVKREQQSLVLVRVCVCCVLTSFQRAQFWTFSFLHIFLSQLLDLCNEFLRYFHSNRQFVKNVVVVYHGMEEKRICVYICVCLCVHTGQHKNKNHWILGSSTAAVANNTWKRRGNSNL